MTWLDKYIQYLRITHALPYILENKIVLDVGCHQGELFRIMKTGPDYGIGIDPLLKVEVDTPALRLIRGVFPKDLPDIGKVDCIAMLAVMEHVPAGELHIMAESCLRLLNQDGLLVVTMPSPKVDRLLKILSSLRLIKGLSLEQHYGLHPVMVKSVFTKAGFTLIAHRSFQFGLNNLIVFGRCSPAV